MSTHSSSGSGQDAIIVSGLELSARVGVPDEERSEAQRLTLEMTLFPRCNFSETGDDLSLTVDYFQLTRRIRRLSAERPRKLIETLVSDLADCILSEFAVREVHLELRKYILADTSFVAVRIQRTV